MLRLAQLRDGGIPGIEDLAVLLQGLGEGEVIKIRVQVQGVRAVLRLDVLLPAAQGRARAAELVEQGIAHHEHEQKGQHEMHGVLRHNVLPDHDAQQHDGQAEADPRQQLHIARHKALGRLILDIGVNGRVYRKSRFHG